MTYRVIALDLDGTLLNNNKQILPQSITALSQARQQGMQVILVTGRHHTAVKPYYRQLGLDTPILCCNGTYIYDFHRQTVLQSNPLTLSQSLQIIDLLDAHNITALMYIDDAMTFQTINDNSRRLNAWAQSLSIDDRPNLLLVDDFKATAQQATSIWKFATLAPDDDNDKLHRLSQQIERELNLPCEFSWHNQMDIGQANNNKGNLLATWVAQHGFSMSEVIAFGDNFNDLSMLEAAGLGVAMANSADQVKAKADLVTTTNEEPGIAEVLQKYVLHCNESCKASG